MNAANIKALRLRLNLTQKQFAEAIYIHQSTLSMYENDKTTPSSAIMAHIDNLAKSVKV